MKWQIQVRVASKCRDCPECCLWGRWAGTLSISGAWGNKPLKEASNTSLPPSFIHSTNNPCLLSLCVPWTTACQVPLFMVSGSLKFLWFLSYRSKKFEATSGPVLQPYSKRTSVQFNCCSSVLFLKTEEIHPQSGRVDLKRHKKSWLNFWEIPLFVRFSPPPRPAYIGGLARNMFVYLRSSLGSGPLFYFVGFPLSA